MPWTYQWTIGYTDASALGVEHGYNGAFLDRGDVDAGFPTGKLDWINQFKLRFYVDHRPRQALPAPVGRRRPAPMPRHCTATACAPPVNDAMETLEDFIRKNIAEVKSSPYRAAYALDDEISWGHFVHPTMWCVTDDTAAYPELAQGDLRPRRARSATEWITYDDIRPKLATWTVARLRRQPADGPVDVQRFVLVQLPRRPGRVRQHASIPHTPVRLRRRAGPNAFGGYDYAKLMRKVQFIEAYNIGSSQAIIRSFNPHNAIPAVTSHFHQSRRRRHLADLVLPGPRQPRPHRLGREAGSTARRPSPGTTRSPRTYLEAGNKIGPLMTRRGVDARRRGDLLQPSVDPARLDPGRRGARQDLDQPQRRRPAGRVAPWSAMPGRTCCATAGLQYNFLSYVDVIQNGVPSEYRVLILPACLCLSDAEARRDRGVLPTPAARSSPTTCPACGTSTARAAPPAACSTTCSASSTTPR